MSMKICIARSLALFMVATFPFQDGRGATVVGSLRDISDRPLNTRLRFSPTNSVLVTPSGLSAGPPVVIQTTNGGFAVALEAGDYVVSVPLIPWRHPFAMAVPPTNGVINITNLLAAPQTYTYTNNLNYAVK